MIDIDEIERIAKAGDPWGYAATPTNVLELIAEVRRLREENDLLTATQAACDSGSCEHDGCQRRDLIGYRERAAKWVDAFYAAKIDANRYRRLKTFADPSYNVRTISNAHSASLAKEEFITVHAGSWEAMDSVLDGVVTVNTVNIKEQS